MLYNNYKRQWVYIQTEMYIMCVLLKGLLFCYPRARRKRMILLLCFSSLWTGTRDGTNEDGQRWVVSRVNRRK